MNSSSRTPLLLIFASGVVLVAALYLAKGILVPLVLSVFLSFLLSPICGWFERFRLHRIPAVLLTATLGFLVFGVVAWTTVTQVSHIVPNIPVYQHNIETKLSSVNQYAVELVNQVSRTSREEPKVSPPREREEEPRGTEELPFMVRMIPSPSSPLQIFGGIYGTMLEGLATIGIVIVFVIFFLIRREDLRDRFLHLVGTSQLTLTTQVLEDAGSRIGRYLFTLLFVNIAFGVCVACGLMLIGIPNALLWGILATVFRFIPYIGPWIAAAMPIALSMAISAGWLAPVLTVVLFITLELFNNNFLEPWLYGKNTGVSPVAVLIAAVFWMWLWGPIGLLLATPMTVCVLVIGKHVPQLSFLDILLGTEPVFEPKLRIYQRLLAGDVEEATELLEGFVHGTNELEVYDEVLIPVLAMTETHWQLGELNDSKHHFILQSIQDIVQARSDRSLQVHVKSLPIEFIRANEAEPPQPVTIDTSATIAPSCSIVCLPCRTEADEMVCAMFAHLLAQEGGHVRIVDLANMKEDGEDLLRSWQADLFLLSATPPAAMMHTRHLVRRIREVFPTVPIIAGTWNTHGKLPTSKDRTDDNTFLVTTLADSLRMIRERYPNTAQILLPIP